MAAHTSHRPDGGNPCGQDRTVHGPGHLPHDADPTVTVGGTQPGAPAVGLPPGDVPDPVARAVAAALHRVKDPCSLAAGSPLSVLDMGLIRSWAYDPDSRRMELVMITTSPGCFLSANMIAAMCEEIGTLDVVEGLDVRVGDQVWFPDMLSPTAQERLAKGREQRLRRSGVRPQAWKTAGSTAPAPTLASLSAPNPAPAAGPVDTAVDNRSTPREARSSHGHREPASP